MDPFLVKSGTLNSIMEQSPWGFVATVPVIQMKNCQRIAMSSVMQKSSWGFISPAHGIKKDIFQSNV